MNARLICAAAIVLVAMLIPVGAAERPAPPTETTAVEQQPRHVDLAICLDTSGSMSGLIDSAKQKLWAIVNELAGARPRPVLRVALYHYGNSGLDAETGWVKQLSPLTNDLDKVYGELFKLTTNGGTELVARVVRSATQELDWSDDPNALRIIVVAGNEPATQDNEYKLQDICQATAAKGIIINTIHCGNTETGRQTGWADAARWADGKYAAIDQNGGTVTVQSPYDKQLAELSAKLNETYVAYGAAGEARRDNQVAQDANAASVNAPAAAERAAAKAGDLYRNDSWDLVDASEKEDFDIAEVPTEELPEKMREMSDEQKKQYVEEKRAERARIAGRIEELNEKRQAYVREQQEKQGLSEESAFDAVLRSAIRDQAQSKGMTFEKPETTEKEEEPAPEASS